MDYSVQPSGQEILGRGCDCKFQMRKREGDLERARAAIALEDDIGLCAGGPLEGQIHVVKLCICI